MKKLVLIVLLTVITQVSKAQNDKGDFTIAPHLGVAFSTYASNADGVGFDARTAARGSVIGEYYFNNRWSFRFGIAYDPMGANDSFDITDKLNYITIPLNANWHFGKTRSWFLNFGPAISILASAESDFPDGSSEDIKDFVNGTSIGLAVGIGYKFNVNETTQIVIDYQGYGGFTDVAEDGVLPYTIRNSRSAFNVGAVFKI